MIPLKGKPPNLRKTVTPYFEVYVMTLAKQIIAGALIAACPLLARADNVEADGTAEGTSNEGWVAKVDWQQRVLQGGPTTRSGPEQAKVDQKRIVRWSPPRQEQVRTASRPASGTATIASRTARSNASSIQTAPEEIPPGDPQMDMVPMPADGTYESIEMGGPEMIMSEPGAASCNPGGVYYEGYGEPYGAYGPGGYHGVRSEWWARDLSLFVGAHGFKGPFDQGRNGNFGLHEGINFGAPLGGPWGWGYQVGFTVAHSNFAGDQATGSYRRGDRDQFFFTAGLFHRALCGGIQWGVAFDLVRDTYYANGDLKQFRHEIGYVYAGGRKEIGYLGVYGMGSDEFELPGGNMSLEPTDLFACYWRRQFQGGGEGRFWAGFTGRGDGLLGADLLVPLGRSWALENRVGFILPEQGRGADGQREEAWAVSVRLIWYLGQAAHSAQKSPYRPMLNVADNSVFMSDFVER